MRLAVVGGTGEVGRTALRILEERNFPAEHTEVVCSERSAGCLIPFGSKHLRAQSIDSFDPSEVGFAIFSAGAAVAAKYAPKFVERGCSVVDNSSCFRNDPDKLLIVPEVNGHHLEGISAPTIIANPNCTTIQIVVALAPIQQHFGLSRVEVCTYQAVSGAGRKGINQLHSEAAGDATGTSPFAAPIYGNVIPKIDDLLDNGYTKEEIKVIRESRKILGDPTLAVNCTAARVPVVNGHSAALHVQTKTPVSTAEVQALLRHAPGVKLLEDALPTPRTHADGCDFVYIGRVRRDLDDPCRLSLWVVADNLRKGAATNAIQIVEALQANIVTSVR